MNYKERDEIKIITGVRGVGKTSILKLFRQKLIDSGIDSDCIISIDLESVKYCFTSYAIILYDLVAGKIVSGKRNFLLIDEVQRVNDWQEVIIKLKANFDIDIYISNSGASIIDDEFCDKLKYKPLEIHVLPLSFKEYLDFISNEGLNIDVDKAFGDYLNFGGMPIPSAIDNLGYLRNIFFSTMAQDVLAGSKIVDNSTVLLIAKILFTEMGHIHSFNSIGKILIEIEEKSPSVRTIENYIKMLVDAKLFYTVPVFDIKLNCSLTRYIKYYPVDLGIYSLMIGSHEIYDKNILESIIYFELLRLGVKVSTCKIGNKKVAFLAESKDNKIYIHVSNSVKDSNNNFKAKEFFAPLRAINDHYSKWILTLDKVSAHSQDGIRISNIIDFLLDE